MFRTGVRAGWPVHPFEIVVSRDWWWVMLLGPGWFSQWIPVPAGVTESLENPPLKYDHPDICSQVCSVRVLEGINKLARTFTWTSLHLTCDDHLGECGSKKESVLHRWLPTISQSFDNIWYAMPVPQNMPPARKDSAQFLHLSSLCKQRIIMISILCSKLTYPH